jgi:hypothetical protein
VHDPWIYSLWMRWWYPRSALLLLKVRIEMKRVERGEINTDGTVGPNGQQKTAGAEAEGGRKLALGARLCDRLLFGEQRSRYDDERNAAGVGGPTTDLAAGRVAGGLRTPLLRNADHPKVG